jgi:YggT family protein
MGMIGFLIGTALLLFQLALFARLVLDWVGALARGGGPTWTSQARRLTHAVTEPVIAPVRRVLRPVRFGSISIDLAFTVVLVAVVVLRGLVVSL